MQQRRVVIKFDEEENKTLNKNIKNSVSEITNQIHNCEKSIQNLSDERTNNKSQKQIIKNMKLYLTDKFSEFTRNFKYNEEIYSRKYKELGVGKN